MQWRNISHYRSAQQREHDCAEEQTYKVLYCIYYLQNLRTTNLSAHEHVDEGVVGGAGLGKERGDDGHCGRDHALPAEGLHHGHNSVGRPTQQEAGDHQEKHDGYLLLIPQDLDDLNRLEVLDGAQLQETRRGRFYHDGYTGCCWFGSKFDCEVCVEEVGINKGFSKRLNLMSRCC